jgi:lysophospholipid acyltransferase (LPLAT)-like uncharacterized protein
MLKSLTSAPAVQAVLGRILGGYGLFAGWTTRWRFVHREPIAELLAGESAIIKTFWHGGLIFTHVGWPLARRRRLRMLVSQSRDGGTIAVFAACVSAEPIRGSTAKKGQQRGGAEALLAMAKHLKAGGDVGFTPDGPRGPRMRAGLGVVQLAKLTRATIVPMAWSASHAIRFKSWDRMLFLLPFGRGVYVYGTPMTIARDLDDAGLEAARARLEAEMIALAQEADRLVGRTPVEPAAPPTPVDDRQDHLIAT